MKLIIDGKEVEFDHQVKVIYEDEFMYDDGDEMRGELHITLTEEGIITDLYHEDNPGQDCDATMAWDKEYLIEGCI